MPQPLIAIVGDISPQRALDLPLADPAKAKAAGALTGYQKRPAGQPRAGAGRCIIRIDDAGHATFKARGPGHERSSAQCGFQAVPR